MNKTEKLSEHFRKSEFRCKCGGNHETKVDSELISRLEKLRSALRCSKIIVNSGYRCPTHDKNVGGSGRGQHTTGKAADIVCYGADGKVISSKIVTCAAQDIGFSGIANIDGTYTATHVDVATRKWYGDETITASADVTKDFYSHWGLSKADVYGESVPKKDDITLIINGTKYKCTPIK